MVSSVSDMKTDLQDGTSAPPVPILTTDLELSFFTLFFFCYCYSLCPFLLKTGAVQQWFWSSCHSPVRTSSILSKAGFPGYVLPRKTPCPKQHLTPFWACYRSKMLCTLLECKEHHTANAIHEEHTNQYLIPESRKGPPEKFIRVYSDHMSTLAY